MLLNRIQHAVTARFSPEVYHGARALMIAPDFVLSYLAKRSPSVYRMWHRVCVATTPVFERGGAQPQLGDSERTVLGQLRQHGCATNRSTFTDVELAEARRFVVDLAARARRSPAVTAAPPGRDVLWDEGNLHFEVLQEDGRIRIHFAAGALEDSSIPEVIRSFPSGPGLLSVIKAYFDTGAIVDHVPYYMAEVMEPAARLETWHIDCIRPTVKVFLALDDIDDDQAPLRYVPGSHRVDEQKLQLFAEIAAAGLGAAYFDEEHCRRFDTECRRLTAKAGTEILFDTRGVHAGSLCRAGQRVVLAMGYRPRSALRMNPRILKDPRPAPYPWQRPMARDLRYPGKAA
jgi:hypothetical protein